MKTALNGTRLDTDEERISEQNKNNENKNKIIYIQKLWYNIKWCNIGIIVIMKEERPGPRKYLKKYG